MERRPGFWTSETLRARLPQLIDPLSEDRIKYAAYELSMGAEAFVSGDVERRRLGERGEVVIPQGQFAILITEERVSVPADAIAFISMKSEKKFRGLINVSGFHVDPGWAGKLLFSVFNAGVQEIHISRGEPLFLIWYASLDSTTRHLYDGKHQDLDGIPDEMITNIAARHPSPTTLQKDIQENRQALQAELNDLRKDVAHGRGVVLMLVTLAFAALLAFLTNVLKPTAQSAPVQITVGNPTLSAAATPSLSVPLQKTPNSATPSPPVTAIPTATPQ